MTVAIKQDSWSANGLLLWGFLLIGVLVGGFGVWAVWSEISGAVISTGRVEVERNRQIVQHSEGGVVAEIVVQEGDVVAEGDLLVRLDPTEIISELVVVEGQLFEVLARVARLEAERDGADTLVFDPLLTEADTPVVAELMEGQDRLFRARLESALSETEQLSRQQEQIADQILGIKAQQEAIGTQLGLIAEELADQQSLLDRGLAQSSRVLSLEREQANLIGRQGELVAAVAQAEGRITEIDVGILRIGSARREEAITTLRDLQYNEIELAERRAQLLTLRDKLEIRAPVAGTVYDLRVFGTGAVIQAGAQLLYIVPQDRPLIITTQVEPRHVDEVLLGQAVRVRFPAFNQRTTPELTGKVVNISADVFTDEATRGTYYRAEVALDDGQIDLLPEGLTLIPGMPVETFISTDERTPFQYLLKPMSDYFARIFRES
jgi:HlyD family secretion protein